MRRVVAMALVCACGRIGFDGRTGDAADPDADPTAFRQIVAYANQTCALLGSRAWCWGENGDGQIGSGANGDALVPTEVMLPPGTVTRISQGEGHACAIVGDTVHCWGRDFGALPVVVALPGPATEVACGRDFTCAIASKVYCWGKNDAGQLGDLQTADRAAPGEIDSVKTTFTALRAGDDHACAHEPNGTPECWGHNDEGALGTGSFTPNEARSPVPVTGGIATLPLIAGWHACALEGGAVKCWGRNQEGELGNGTQVPSAIPVSVSGLANVSAIATGGGPTNRDASCAITDGAMHCWGAGIEGRLGNGDTSNALLPVGVVGLPGRALAAAIGYDHTCALLEDGDVYCWGNGDRGQLGDGARTSSLAPVRVTRPR